MDFHAAFNELEIYGQQHLLKYYDQLTQQQQEVLLAQIDNIDWKLLDLLGQENAIKKIGRTEPPRALELKDIYENRKMYEETGLEAIKAGKIGAVLLAGGQGTRLGFDRPKGTLNVGITKDLYLFEILIDNLIEVTEKAGTWVPFYIMELCLQGKPSSREAIQKALEINPEVINTYYSNALSHHMSEVELEEAIEGLDRYLDQHMDIITKPVLEFMADQEIKTSTLISKHFHAEGHFIIGIFDYLADKGIIEKVSQTIRITPKSRMNVEEVGYLYIP